MSTVLLEQLEEVGLDKEPHKVIYQTYNGVNIMREDTIVHHLIREKYPYTMYVHCYAYHRHLLLRNSERVVRGSAKSSFLSRLVKHTSVFRVSRENGAFNGGCKASPLTREYLREHTVNAVYENNESLLECLEMSRDSADSDCTRSRRRQDSSDC